MAFLNCFILGNDLPPRKNYWQKWIVENQEPPSLYRIGNFLDGKINLTCTYHKHSDLPCVYGYYFPLDKYYLGPYLNIAKTDRNNIYLEELINTYKKYRINLNSIVKNKAHEVLWFVSHCGLTERDNLANQLEQNGIKINRFGSCGQHDPCKDKFDVKCVGKYASKYWFYLAFENSICEYYITEKPWNAFIHGIVPIVYGPGAEVYNQYLPPNSFLHVNNFSNMYQLGRYLKYLMTNTKAYMKYHEWRKDYDFLRAHDFDYLQLCTMCKQYNSNHINNSYNMYSKEWHTSQHCNNNVIKK